MASTATSSNSSSSSIGLSRLEAGPLPSKRGEIGFREDIHTQVDEGRRPSLEAPLPTRHPADRDAVQVPDATSANSSPSTNSSVASTAAAASTTSLPSSSSSATDSISKKKRILHFFKPKSSRSYGGIHLNTFLVFIAQFIIFGGTIAGWALSVMSVTRHHPSSDVQSTAVFIHIIFGVAILAQLLFLERTLFRLRAERYSFIHPGEILPSHRYRGTAPSPSIAFTPWNRPPLPTYAATLAQSGVGTGDVEDHIIAALPPPAYGNTRGSTLLLSGFLRDSLRAQRPVSSQSDRPVSYASRDVHWQENEEAERARRLDETLSRLEGPGPLQRS